MSLSFHKSSAHLMLKNYICAVDIGSSKLAAAVAEIKARRIARIFFETLPLRSVKKGAVVDAPGFVNSLSRLLKNLKNKSGVNIKFIYSNIFGQDIVTRHSRAVIPLAGRGNKVITRSDIERVNEQARLLGSNLEEEIVYSLPSSYTIDSKSNIFNPLGLYSHRLEADLYLVYAKLSNLQTISRIVNQTGYEIRDLFVSGIAVSRIIFCQGYEKGLNIFCDIGSDTTELLVFKDGLLKNIEILSFGGDDLTREISATLKIPFDLAEETKRSYAITGDYAQMGDEQEILIKRDNLYKTIKQRLISEIATSKSESICAKIKDAVEKITPLEEINNFVASGRTVLLEGFLEILESRLGISVKLARITHPDMLSLLNSEKELSGRKYLNYLNSLGIISEVLYSRQSQVPFSNPCPSRNPILQLINKAREVYEEYF